MVCKVAQICLVVATPKQDVASCCCGLKIECHFPYIGELCLTQPLSEGLRGGVLWSGAKTAANKAMTSI